MNDYYSTYFQPKEVSKAAQCFNCKATKENKKWFIDQYQKLIIKKKSLLCEECLEERTEYYQNLEKEGKDIGRKIKGKLKEKKNLKTRVDWESKKYSREFGKFEIKNKNSDEELENFQKTSHKRLQLQSTKLQKESRKKDEKIKNLERSLSKLELKLKGEPLKNQEINKTFELNKVYNLDCLELFKRMKESKITVDAIITDPPYNISKSNNFTSIGRAGIDFGHWDYGFDQSAWIKESYSLLKKGGSIIIFNDWKNFGKISKTLEEVGYEVKDLLRWIKKNPMPRNTGRRYVTDYELAIWAVKNGKKWTFNFKKRNDKPYLIPQYEGSVVIGKKRIHPTQKSLQLFKDIIEVHTSISDLVLDPFMGSGTTAVACQELGRNYIGSEIDTDYFNKAELRIRSCKPNKVLTEEYIKSPINYTGNKYKLLKQIMPLFPKKINKFVDVFGGSGTMIANVSAKNYFYNDNNSYVVSLIEYFKNNSYELITEKIEELIKNFSLSDSYKNGYETYGIMGNKGLSKNNKEGYKKLRDYYNETNDINALFCLIIFGFNHQIRFNEKKMFNIPVGKADFNEKVRKNLKKFTEKLKNIDVEIKNEDFSKFLEETEVGNEDFVYCDPPYLITDATYNESWNEKKEKKLLSTLDYLNKKGVKFALSNVIESNGRKNLILTKWAKDYKVNFLNFSYNGSNYQRKNKGKTIEVLITNY